MTVLKKTNQIIHCQIDTRQQGPLIITFIQASNGRDGCKLLWNDLRLLQTSVTIHWGQIGDFNATNPAEVSYPGKNVSIDGNMTDFRL